MIGTSYAEDIHLESVPYGKAAQYAFSFLSAPPL